MIGHYHVICAFSIRIHIKFCDIFGKILIFEVVRGELQYLDQMIVYDARTLSSLASMVPDPSASNTSNASLRSAFISFVSSSRGPFFFFAFFSAYKRYCLISIIAFINANNIEFQIPRLFFDGNINCQQPDLATIFFFHNLQGQERYFPVCFTAIFYCVYNQNVRTRTDEDTKNIYFYKHKNVLSLITKDRFRQKQRELQLYSFPHQVLTRGRIKLTL